MARADNKKHTYMSQFEITTFQKCLFHSILYACISDRWLESKHQPIGEKVERPLAAAYLPY